MLLELLILSGGGTALWNSVRNKNTPPVATAESTNPVETADRQPVATNAANLPAPAKSPQARQTSFFFKAKKLAWEVKEALWGGERQQLQLMLNPEIKAELVYRQKKEKRNLILSAGAVGMAALSPLSPVFYLLGSVAVLYLARHLFRFLWHDFKQKHFFSTYLLPIILIIGMVLNGQLLFAAIAGFIGGLVVKLIKKAEENSQKHLIDVFAGHPKYVWLEKAGVEIQVPFEEIHKTDIVVVQAGDVIPVDGIIQSGEANIDQHVLTGESQPVEKGVGDEVFAATVVLAGRIRILVKTAGEETVAANIGHILNDTKDYKESLILRGKKIADTFLPLELTISAVTLGVLGTTSALSVLWSSMGYRMIAYGPISVLNYLQVLAKQGILIKDGRVLEALHQVDTVVFDKTGTLTLEQPLLGKIHLLADYNEAQLLRYAASAEYRQTHPIAKAIIDKALEQQIDLFIPEQVNYEVGYGVAVTMEQKTVQVGSKRFMQREGIALPVPLADLQQKSKQSGHSLIYVAIDGVPAGVLEIQPRIRPEAKALITALHQRGISTYIISGDHEQPTRNIAHHLGVNHYFAETLPEQKAELIHQLRTQGKFVCFIGDGINDAVALKTAQISISLQGASTAAIDTAQIIFMNGSLTPLRYLFQLSDEFEQTMQNNLMISIIPGTVIITGVYLLHFGIAASMGVYYLGTAAGLTNSISPLLKHQDNP